MNLIRKPSDATFDFTRGMKSNAIMAINHAIDNGEFHYNTNDSDYFIVVASPAPFDDSVGDSIVKDMIEAGWDAKYENQYCGHGPFKAFLFRTEDLNPKTVNFKTKF